MVKFVPPAINVTGFNCPHCQVLNQNTWYSVLLSEIVTAPEYVEDVMLQVQRSVRTEFPVLRPSGLRTNFALSGAWVSVCGDCKRSTIWVESKQVFPQSSTAPLPNPDMPDEVREDYIEAGQILQISPRGAAALLRLALQKLCVHLGGKGDNIDADIKLLVKNGLSSQIQRSLDIIRFTGSQAVHPLEMDLKNAGETVHSLFKIMNIIVERMISEERQISELFEGLPESKKLAIEKRDNVTPGGKA